ncbi:MAG: alpha/beta fold hydrolase [Flavobacteriales bacterium]|nr:alpha/beta fold hydrolase [Flavobacteriales bacterium]
MAKQEEIIPTILIPGIQATALAESNSFDRKILWRAFDNLGTSIWTTVFGMQLDAALQQDPRYDVDPASIVERDHISPMPYRAFVKGLAAKCPSWPIFLFGYDWRKSNADSATELVGFVEHILGKLATERKVRRVNIVTHSMGSYVLLAALPFISKHIHKVVLCAPPLRGSPQAYKNMVLGPSSLLGNSDDVRKVARTYPSLYELLPWYPKALMSGTRELDLLVRDDWQSNVYHDIQPLVDARLAALKQFRAVLGPDVPTALARWPTAALSWQGWTKTAPSLGLPPRPSTALHNYVDFTENKNSQDDGDGTVPSRA